MFSLLATIISIALVALLAIATIYYGGQAFDQSVESAQAAEVINVAQQIDGADTLLFASTGEHAGSISQLVATQYLATVPQGEWHLVEGQVMVTDVSANACLQANRRLGIDTVPLCSDPAYAEATVCCQLPE